MKILNFVLNSSIKETATKSYVNERIIPLSIGNGSSYTFNIRANGAIVIFPRNSCVFMINYQSHKTVDVYGTIPSECIVSKIAGSAEVTITNNIGYTLNGFIITC